MCAIFGLLDYGNTLTGKERHQVLEILAQTCEVRGTDATGFAYFDNSSLVIQKRPKRASKMKFYVPDGARFVMGHTRMTTQGSEKRNQNNHPFAGSIGNRAFALAHNGVLHNDAQLRKTYQLPKTKIETDSYVAVQLLEQEKSLNFSAFKHMAERLEGTFTMTALTKEALYIVKGNNPVCLYHFPTLRLYLYASTEEILNLALSSIGLDEFEWEQIDVLQGEILRIHTSGRRESAYFDTANLLPRYYSRGWGWNDYACSTFQEDDDDLHDVCNVALCMGMSEAELELLIDAGYDALDIEELLYDPELRQCCMQEILH